APHQASVFAKQIFDSGAEIRRIETGLHAEAPQDVISKLSMGSVDALGDQDVISAFQEGEIDQRNCALASGRNDGAVAFFQLADFSRELEGGGCAVEPIRVADFVLVPTVFDRSSVGK